VNKQQNGTKNVTLQNENRKGATAGSHGSNANALTTKTVDH
jgi:hypothetical protein